MIRRQGIQEQKIIKRLDKLLSHLMTKEKGLLRSEKRLVEFDEYSRISCKISKDLEKIQKCRHEMGYMECFSVGFIQRN